MPGGTSGEESAAAAVAVAAAAELAASGSAALASALTNTGDVASVRVDAWAAASSRVRSGSSVLFLPPVVERARSVRGTKSARKRCAGDPLQPQIYGNSSRSKDSSAQQVSE